MAYFLICAIQLSGVTGSDLRARAFFDANNVKVGDPLILTVDFVGSADFKDIHPPALSRAVSAKDWKVDDASAKTDTFRDARRLTYRVRPMRAGVLYFPPLEFDYQTKDGSLCRVRANEIPVHARASAQVVVAEMAEDPNELPKPPNLVMEPGVKLSSDERFAWQKACSHPTADGFAAFDFPAAKLNEASCAIREGNWARAMGVYRRLEWRIGQTAEIERGLVAALALKADNPSVELPIARQVLRPLLRFAWVGRVGIVLGAIVSVMLVFGLLGRIIRVLACLALLVTFVTTASAETIETVTTNANGSITHRRVTTSGNGNFSFSFSSSSTSGGDPFQMMDAWEPFGARRSNVAHPPVELAVTLETDKPSVSIGEDFNLILSIDRPRDVSFADGVRLSILENEKMQQTGAGQSLKNIKSKNPTNIVQRLAFPMRANEAFTNLHFSVDGEYVFANDHPFFRTATPYRSGNKIAPLTVQPLPTKGRPAEFGGIVSEGLSLFETCDLLRVHTNDVVTITYRLRPKGYVPMTFLPKEVAFEWKRQNDPTGRLVEIEYRRYFVADGTQKTPRFSVSYYDPKAKAYKTVAVDGTPLKYLSDDEV